MASTRVELNTLKKLIAQVDLILSITELPQNRTARCRELPLAVLEALKVKGVMTEEEFQKYQALLQQKPEQTQSLMNQTWMRYEIFARMFGLEIHGNPPETPNNPKLH